MKFEYALVAAKNGLMIRRSSWYAHEFIFIQVPCTISKEIVAKMRSLPDSVKAEFERRFSHPVLQVDAIYSANQMAMVDASNLIQSYSPSVADCLAEDWQII